MNDFQKNLAVLILCATALGSPPVTTVALTRIADNGNVVQMHSISGFVVDVAQDRRSITLHWLREHTRVSDAAIVTNSCQQSFRVADAVVFKSGSWSNVVKGAKVRLIGDGELVEQIRILK
jgi:hypothetical protein